MNLGFDMATQKPTGAGYDEYQKFIDDLIIKAIDFLMNLKEKISSNSGQLNKHLKEEIEDIINITKENANRKLTLGLEELDELTRPKSKLNPGISNSNSLVCEAPQAAEISSATCLKSTK